MIGVAADGAGGVELSCGDLFKLKPNVQQSPRNRIDIYMPGTAAAELGADILALSGPGDVAELSDVNPDDFRRGPQALPKITESRTVTHRGAGIRIAGVEVSGSRGAIYLDQEAPQDGFIEMKGPEVHIGVPLQSTGGSLDPASITAVDVPSGEIRVLGEKNPVNKADGEVWIRLDQKNAADLAATLLRYGREG
jgi:hypothetical protein